MKRVNEGIFLAIALGSVIAVAPLISAHAQDGAATSFAAPYSPAWQRVCNRVEQPQPPPHREPNATPARYGTPEDFMKAHCDQYLRAAASFERAHQIGRSTR